jgi:muramoyltetrapeptide carboxypeptidase
MKSVISVGVVAPCSPVGQVELGFGVEFLRESGFEVTLHPQCAAQHFVCAGTDTQRAQALLDYALDPEIDVIWAARGGYGAGRLLPILRQLTRKHGKPAQKLLVGYSDVTMLHEFVRKQWDWHTLHAPMPAANLRALKPDEWHAIVELVRGRRAAIPWQQTRLQWLTPPPPEPINAKLIGGNLSLWCCLAGTDYQPKCRRKVVFLEDLGERPYRIDRMCTHLVQAGMMKDLAALVLGDFTDCADENATVLEPPTDEASQARLRGDWTTGQRIPLRRTYSLDESLDEIFGTVGRRLGIPVAKGLPVGHGPNFSPLPLGARYELRPDGTIDLIKWKWLAKSSGSSTA